MRRLFVVEARRVLDSRSVKIGTRVLVNSFVFTKTRYTLKDRKTVEGQASSDGGGRGVFHVTQT